MRKVSVGKLVLGSMLALLVAGGAWLGWRWYTTPALPDVPIDQAEKAVREEVSEALGQVRQQPRSGAAWGNLAMVLAVNGYDEQCVLCFRHAEHFDPHNPCWPYLRGLKLLSDSPRLAVPLFRRALDLADIPETRAAILFRLARTLIEEGQLAEAEQHLQALSQIEADSARVHFGLGLLGVAREQPAVAREHLRALLDNPFARSQACTLLATLEDEPEKVRGYQQQAARLPHDFPWPDPFEAAQRRRKVQRMRRIDRFTELERQGRHAEALTFLRQFVAESPDAEVCHILGHVLFQRNEVEDAETVLRAALRFDPENVPARYLLGAALLQHGEKQFREASGQAAAEKMFREAVSAEDQVLARQGDHADAHLIRGLALKSLGHTGKSLQALRQALLCRPERADLHLALGEALAEAGQVREALEHLQNAERLAKPGDVRPRQAREKWQARVKPTS